jgi:hypothetical protein
VNDIHRVAGKDMGARDMCYKVSEMGDMHRRLCIVSHAFLHFVGQIANTGEVGRYY